MPVMDRQDTQDDAQNHGKIMIVDDEPAVGDYLGELLRRQGYDVVVETESKIALATLKQTPTAIDLIITDQTMPDMTGLELAAEIRSLQLELPIILLSGYSEQINSATATGDCIQAYFRKPIDSSLLLEKVDELLNSPGDT